MDFTIIIERLNQLTALWNTLVANSKKIFELPEETAGEKLIATYNTTSNETEQFNLTNLVDSFYSLSNRILTYGEYSNVLNVYTFEVGYTWLYNGINYANTSEIDITIDDATDGFYRGDIIVVDTNNDILKVVGIENDSIAVFPDVPEGMLLLYTISVFGDEIEIPVVPIVGFVEKEIYAPQTYNGAGVLNAINMDSKKSVLELIGTTTELFSIQKNSFNYFSGQPFFIDNRQSIDVLLRHNDGTGNIKLWFPNLDDFILKPGYKAMFMFNLISFRYEYVGEIFDIEIIGATGEITVISGVVGIDPAYTTARDSYADGKIAQTITNGVTDSAPSQDAVFEALALKANLAGGNTFTGTQLMPILGINCTTPLSGVALNVGNPNNISGISPSVAIQSMGNNVQGVTMENTSTGTVAEMRLSVKGNDSSYLFLAQPGSNNTSTTFFGVPKNTGSFLLTTNSLRNLHLGTVGAGSVNIGTNNITGMTMNTSQVVNFVNPPTVPTAVGSSDAVPLAQMNTAIGTAISGVDLDDVLTNGSVGIVASQITLQDNTNAGTSLYSTLDLNGGNTSLSGSTYTNISSNVSSLRLDVDGVKITSNNDKSAYYDADYSANYTARSLVDKAYVDSVSDNYVPLAGTGANPITGDLEILEDLTIFSLNPVGQTPRLRFSDSIITEVLDTATQDVLSQISLGSDGISLFCSDVLSKGIVGNTLFNKSDDPNAYQQIGDNHAIGLGITATAGSPLPSNDLDLITHPTGIYSFTNAATGNPTGDNGSVTIERISTNIVQTAKVINAVNLPRVFVRQYRAGSSVWTDWRELSGTDDTGWQQITDATYTVGSPLTILEGVTGKIQTGTVTEINTQLPSDVTTFWNNTTDKLTGTNDGDSFSFALRFKAKMSIANGYADIRINIGGALGVIASKTVLFHKGADTEQRFEETFTYFTGTTFIANGGDIEVIPQNGDIEIYDIVLVPVRTHKGR